MEKNKLKEILNTLSLKEKIAQTVQLNGDLFTDSGVMPTGPLKDLGLPDNFDIHQVGSIYNVNDPEKLRMIQEQAINKSSHGIPLLFMSDIIYGFRTIFPLPLAQAGSYDFDLIQKAAEITAKESYLSGIHCVFSPMLDVVRDPRWGRVMESPGEDIYTGKEYAKSVVTGYQGQVKDYVSENHVAACIKHFAAYGAPEAGREYSTVDMSNQRLFNEYLPTYQAAIEAHALLVMTAFNVLNGIPSTGNKWLNRDILREKFNFSGLLVSDHSATEELQAHGFTANQEESAKASIEAGVDFDMMTSVYANGLEPLILSGKVDEALLDEAVWRILKLKNKLGLFENPFRGLDQENTGEFLTAEAKETAVELVEKSCVLLKNKENALPLSTQQKIAVIGPYGKSKFTLGFWASVSGKAQDTVTLKEGLENNFAKKNLTFATGYNLFDSYESFGPLKTGIEHLNGPIGDEKELIEEAVEVAGNSDVILLTIGEQFLESGEGASKAKLSLPDKQIRLIKALAQLDKPIIGLLYTGRPLVLTEIEPYFSSLLLVWYPGTMGGAGIANLLSGQASPSAKLTMTFPRSEGQIPIYYAQNTTGRPLNEENKNTRFVSKYSDESNEPLYAFGTGLTYNQVDVKWLENMENLTFTESNQIKLAYQLENLSNETSHAVVHLYMRDMAASIVQPFRKLVASQFIKIEPSTKEELAVTLTKEDLSFSDNQGEWHFESGKFGFYLVAYGQEEELIISL